MAASYFDLLQDKLREEIALRTQTLVRGTGSREADERLRGVLDGLNTAIDVVRDVEDRARRSEE